MGDASRDPVTVARQYFKHVLVRIALMQKDRQAGICRKLKLRLKGRTLIGARREIAKIVEPALTDGDDGIVREELLERLRAVPVEFACVMRVHAGRGIQYAAVGEGEFGGLDACRDCRAGHDHAGDADGCGVREHRLAVAIEAVVSQIQTNVDIIGHRGIVTAGRFRGNRAPRIDGMRTSLVIAVATLGFASLAVEAVELDGSLRDAAARIDYGWYTGDVGLVAAAGDSLAAQRDGPWVHYLRAYAAFREAELRQARGNSAEAAIDTCEREAGSAAEVPAAAAEATVLIAACAALAANEEPARALLHQRRFRQALARAVELDRDNPRLWLIGLNFDPDAGNGLAVDPVTTVEAFRARGGFGYPDWGEAEALTRLGELRLDEGNLRAARDLLEEALLIAPDYTTARRLQGRIAELAQAN